jgi:hypothetical protein
MILQKVHQGLCTDNNTHGKVVKEILSVSMVRGMSAELRHTEIEDGHCTYFGFLILEKGISCAC